MEIRGVKRGGATTAEDLLLFLDFLQNGRFIGRKSLEAMAAFEHRYRPGLHYGLGMMQVRFEEFFSLLKGMPRLRGHLGVTGVHAWYDLKTGATFALNVGNTGDMGKSFRLLIKIIKMLYK